MTWIWVKVFVIYFGQQCIGVVLTHTDGYTGCYMRLDLGLFLDTIIKIPGNSGRACKNNCFPNYRYAATSNENCVCMATIHGYKIQDTECSIACPDQTNSGETCGGFETFTVYDAQEITTTDSPQSVSTALTTLKITTSQEKTRVLGNGMKTTRITSQVVMTVEETTTQSSNMDRVTSTSTQSPLQTYPVTSTPLKNKTGCVLICVAVTMCLVIINNIVLSVCKKLRRPKTATKPHVEGYGYISPVHINEGDVTSDGKVLPVRNVDTANAASTNLNMYDYVDSNITERQYTDLL